jgi:hypothetical protein
MEIDPATGKSNKGVYQLEYRETSSATPTYGTWGALYFDKKDYFSGKQFYYTAFTMNDKIEMIRLEVPRYGGRPPRVDWNFEFYEFAATEAADLYRRKEPMNIHMDPLDRAYFYLTGRYHGRGSVMRFNKQNGRLKWYAKMDKMTTVRAWAQVPRQKNFYGCGDFETGDVTANVASAEHTSAIFRMDNTGNMVWYSVLSGSNPVSSSANQDRCFGLSFDSRHNELTALLQIKASSLREYSEGDFYDTALILMDTNGRPKKSETISFASSAYDIYLPNDALQTANGYYFWSAYAYGYQTRLQSLQGTAYDAFTFRFDWDMDYYRCLWSKEYSRRTVASS